jgi:hypothetical protein
MTEQDSSTDFRTCKTHGRTLFVALPRPPVALCWKCVKADKYHESVAEPARKIMALRAVDESELES